MFRLLLSTLLVLSACDLGAGAPADSYSEGVTSGPSARAVADDLEVTVRLDAARYLTQANTIRCIAAPCPSNAEAPVLHPVITLRNVGDRPMTLDLPSGQRFDLQVFDASGEVVQTWSMDKLFMMSLVTVTLAPGEREEWATELAFVPDLAGEFTLRATVSGASAAPEVAFRVDLP